MSSSRVDPPAGPEPSEPRSPPEYDPASRGSHRPLRRLLAEGAVIVVSVLVALSADAWWSDRLDARRAEAHLEALSRDFAQMAARVDSSLLSSSRGRESGYRLLEVLGRGPSVADADSAHIWILEALDYEVFSPSVGAYEALVASGDLELLDDLELQIALGEFFGSFDDVRISERVLVEHQLALAGSSDFAEGVGFHRIAGFPDRVSAWREGADLPADRDLLATLGASDEFLNRLAAVTVYQGGVRLDYEYLRAKIETIRSMLPPSPTDSP